MTAIRIGTPAIHARTGKRGYVTHVLAAEPAQFMLIGAGTPMTPVRADVEVCFDNHRSTVPDSIAAPWIARAAAGMEPISEGEAASRRAAMIGREGTSREAREQARAAALVLKLRKMADDLQTAIDDKFRDRRRNTPKQQNEAQSARLDGYQLQRAQKALRILADKHEAGTVPPVLAGVTTKAAVLDLCRAKIESSGGYYDAGHETGRPAVETPASLALWDLIGGTSEADRESEKLRQKIDGLRFAKIPGFFPTPPAVVAMMIERARLPEGQFLMLEPSAGSGAIVDEVWKVSPDALLFLFERHWTLRDILMAKGYELEGFDFLESDLTLKVDRVLMNPPFENGQDIIHVQRAFEHLDDGGRLVAIMSPGPFFRQDAKARAFRAWFEALGGEKIDLPAGAFKESGTGVASVLVVIDRDGGELGGSDPSGGTSEADPDPAPAAKDPAGEILKPVAAPAPVPAPSLLEKLERATLEGEIDRLRTLARGQSAEIARLKTKRSRTAARLVSARRQARNDRRLAERAFSKLMRQPPTVTPADGPALIILPIQPSRPRQLGA